jgi:hypothetical protein
MFGNRELKRMVELKREEVIGVWRKLCNEELLIVWPYGLSSK